MQDQGWRSVSVGLFAVGAILITGYLVLLFGEEPSRFVGTNYEINAQFDSGVTNTREGTEVILFGKRIGQVKTIEFVSPEDLAQGVRLTLEIDGNFNLPVGSSALESLTSAVMGRAVIQITVPPAIGETLPRDGSALIVGRRSQPLEGILPDTFIESLEGSVRNVGDLAASLRPVALELEKLLEARQLADVDDPANRTAMGNFSTLVQRVDRLVKNMNVIIGDMENQQNLKASLDNLQQASKRSVEVMDRANLAADSARATFNELRETIAEVRAMAGRMDEMMQGLSGAGIDTLGSFASAASTMERLMVGVEQGRGTAGMLMNDNRLYEAMLDLMVDLKDTSKQMRSMIQKVETGEVNPIKLF